MVSIIARQAQFAPWGNAMCVIKRLIVTDGYRVRKDFTIASCVGFRSDGLEDLALLIICVIWVGGMLGVCWARCWLRPRRPGYVTIQCWGDTQRRAVAEPTLVRRVFLCTMYDTLVKRVCVPNNWGGCQYVQYDTMRYIQRVSLCTLQYVALVSRRRVVAKLWHVDSGPSLTRALSLSQCCCTQADGHLSVGHFWFELHSGIDHIIYALPCLLWQPVKPKKKKLCPRFHFHFWFLLPRPAAPLSVSATCWLYGLSTVDFFSTEHLFGIKQIFTILVIGL